VTWTDHNFVPIARRHGELEPTVRVGLTVGDFREFGAPPWDLLA
jgi:hypothetical protein